MISIITTIPIIIPESIGIFLSVLFKATCIVIMSIVTLIMYRKYKKKNSVILRNLTFTFLFYTIVPGLGLFNTVFNLRNFPYEDGFIILYLGFVFVAFGNCFYYWFIIDVFYRANRPEFSYNKYLTPVISSQLLVAGIAFLLRLVHVPELSLLFIVVHVLISMSIYILLLYNAIRSLKSYNNTTLKRRFRNIAESAICGIITVILIVIDSTYDELSLFNLLSWVFFALNAVFCFFAFIGRKEDGKIALIEETKRNSI